MKNSYHKIIIYYIFKTLNYILIFLLVLIPIIYFILYDEAIHTNQMKGFGKKDFEIFLYFYFIMVFLWLIIFIIYKIIKKNRK